MIFPDDDGHLYVWGYNNYEGEYPGEGESDYLYASREGAMAAAESAYVARMRIVNVGKNLHWKEPHPKYQYCKLKYKGGLTGVTVWRQEVFPDLPCAEPDARVSVDA